MKTWRVGLCLLITTAAACGQKDSDTHPETEVRGQPFPTSTSKGLVFTSVTPGQATPTSNLQYYDFETGKIELVDHGQPQDTLAVPFRGKILYFTRAGEPKFRLVDLEAKEETTKVEPLATPSAAAGDPFDTLVLSDTQMLLANFGAGKLVVFDPATGAASAEVAGEALGFSTDKPFRPVGLHRQGNEVFVIHKGSGEDDPTRVFVLDWDGTALAPSGDDPVTIKATLVRDFWDAGDGTAILLELCPKDPASPCTPGAQRFTFASKKVFDLPVKLDGYTTQYSWASMGDGRTFFGNVRSAAGALQTLKIDVVKGTLDVVHTFEPSSDGLYGLFYDESTKTLFIGDQDSGKGRLWLYTDSQDGESISLQGAPYNGFFVKK